MTEPVALADLKAHLRLDAGATGEDTNLTALLIAARRVCEHDANRSFATLEPDDLAMARQAILLVAGHWYENREAASIDGRGAAAEMPLSACWLLQALWQPSTPIEAT